VLLADGEAPVSSASRTLETRETLLGVVLERRPAVPRRPVLAFMEAEDASGGDAADRKGVIKVAGRSAGVPHTVGEVCAGEACTSGDAHSEGVQAAAAGVGEDRIRAASALEGVRGGAVDGVAEG